MKKAGKPAPEKVSKREPGRLVRRKKSYVRPCDKDCETCRFPCDKPAFPGKKK